MNKVVSMFADQEGAQRRRLLARQELGVDIGQNALGDAYNRVIRDNPEITSDGKRFEYACALALSSLSEAMRYLNTQVAGAADFKRE